MDWDAFSPGRAALGGALLGLGTGLALLLNGKIAGLSGVVARILRPLPGDALWRVWFLAGMLGAGALTFALLPRVASYEPQVGLPALLVAGFLVGFGARYGGGCTSGHGVCGIARGSGRGLAATGIFMSTALVTVFVGRHLLGGAS